MAPRSTSSRRRATSPSAGSPSPSSTDSSPDTLETLSPEAVAPPPPDLEGPVSSAEFELSAEEKRALDAISPPSSPSRARAQLVALVDAVDAYARSAGHWDDVLIQLEAAKALLDLPPQS